MSSRQVRIGVIGIGNMGRKHCLNILEGKCPELLLTAVADDRPERREEIVKLSEGRVTAFSDAEAMMDSGLAEAVLIAVPHYDHPRLAIMAMQKGLHVLCEKPAAVYTLAVREMNRAAKESGVVYGMMFNQRTNHLYRTVKALVDSGRYGKIRRVNWIITDWYRPQVYYDSGEWRATWAGEGGGVLLNQCPHQLDLLTWICGMPVKVNANLCYGRWHDIEVEDDVTAFMEFANGATGCFVASTGDAGGSNRLELQLDRARIIVENGEVRAWEFSESEQEFSKKATNPFSSPEKTPIPIESDGLNPQHIGVMNAFAACILRGEPLIAPGEEGLNGLMLSNAMHLSSWLGREVKLPFDEALYLEELKKRIAGSRRKERTVDAVGNTDESYS